MKHLDVSLPVLAGLGAAMLFGASTPFAKHFAGTIHPVLLAGLLYLGSGIGLTMVRLIRDRGWAIPSITKHEWPWLLGAMVFGGVFGPVLLMLGLTKTSAANASLLLNLESVLTAILAWAVFKENFDRRILIGMLCIVAGGTVLSWPTDASIEGSWLGALAIAGACLCWGVDNNLTRKVSASDALFIAGAKGVVSGTVNVATALFLGVFLPTVGPTTLVLSLGFVGYGLSLVLFVYALRGLGAARTGAYFSTAPFIGAAVAVWIFSESISPQFLIAAALMAIGLYLHLTEHHSHVHSHEPLIHNHAHSHDEHHQHKHESKISELGTHEHEHAHSPLSHSHPHYPDIHHRHKHA